MDDKIRLEELRIQANLQEQQEQDYLRQTRELQRLQELQNTLPRHVRERLSDTAAMLSEVDNRERPHACSAMKRRIQCTAYE
jgi:hypothetical protein